MVWNSWNVISSMYYLTKYESLIIVILMIRPFWHINMLAIKFQCAH